jgi:hypothetical protein
MLVVAFTTCAWSAYAGCSAGLATKVADVNLEQRSAFAALVQFGAESGVCLALEGPGLDLFKGSVSVRASHPTVAYVIQSLLNGGSYQLLESSGAILIRSTDSVRRTTQLDTVVPEYTIPKMSVTKANFALRARLLRLANPSVQGVPASISDRFPDDQIGPIDEHGRTIRDLLTLITRQSPGGAWISGRCSGPGSAWADPCWDLVSYHEEPGTLAAIIANLSNKLVVERTTQRQ